MSAKQTNLSGEIVADSHEENDFSSGPTAIATFTARTLAEIDPETLPRDGWIAEVARRFEARRQGRDGWRTGDIQTDFGEVGGE